MALRVIQGGNADSGLKREVFDAFVKSCGLERRFHEKGVRFFDEHNKRFSEEVLKNSVRFLAFSDGFLGKKRDPDRIIRDDFLLGKDIVEIMRGEDGGRPGIDFEAGGKETDAKRRLVIPYDRIESYYVRYYCEGAAARFDTLKK